MFSNSLLKGVWDVLLFIVSLGGMALLQSRYCLLLDTKHKAPENPRRKLTYRITGAAAIKRITPLLQEIPEIHFVEASKDAEQVCFSLVCFFFSFLFNVCVYCLCLICILYGYRLILCLKQPAKRKKKMCMKLLLGIQDY